MVTEYLSFGNITIKLELPQRPVDIEKYAEFISEEKPADFNVGYSFSDGTIQLDSGFGMTADRDGKTVVIDEENGTYTVYFKAAAGGFYAKRISSFYDSGSEVILSDEARNKLWIRLILNTLGVEELAARKNAFIFHSSFIVKDGKAILFTGPCGIGKSTQADLWQKYKGTEIINGDKTMIYCENGKAYASGLPFSGSSHICLNKSFELDTIVRLEQSVQNSVEPLTLAESFVCLLKSAYIPLRFGDSISRTIGTILPGIRVCRLSCTPDEQAVTMLDGYLKGGK